MYEEELSDFFGKDLNWVISLLIMSAFTYMILTWCGSIFVTAELPRQGHEKLLNSLKEGILILAEEDSVVKFQNQAALRLTSKYSEEFSISKIN